MTLAGEQVAHAVGLPKQRLAHCFGTVPLWNLFTSMCDFAPCDRIVQRAYSGMILNFIFVARIALLKSFKSTLFHFIELRGHFFTELRIFLLLCSLSDTQLPENNV